LLRLPRTSRTAGIKETFLAFHEVVDQSVSSLSELILQNIKKKMECLSVSAVVRAMTGVPICIMAYRKDIETLSQAHRMSIA